MSKQVKLKTNFVYNIIYQITTIILPLITAPYVSRALGSYNVGIYSYTQAFANYFYLFAMLGVNNYGNRTIAAVRDDKEKMSKTFWEIYSLQFILGFVIMLMYLAYCFLYVKTDKLVYIMQFFYVASATFNANWLCFGLEKFQLTTIRSIIVRVSSAVAVFLFVKDNTDVALYTAIIAISSLVSVLAIWPFILKNVLFIKPSIKGIIQHIKPNLVLFWPVVAVSLYNIMDKIMLGWISSKEEVGYYTYAESIVQIPNTLILALDNVVMPRMSNLYATDNDKKAKSLMDTVMLFAMFMASAMSFGLASVGNVFAPWFYGEAFTRCGLFIVMLCPIIIFKGWAGALRTQFIIPTKRDNVFIISLTSGAIVNLVANFILIPRFAGVGAVIGTVVAELTVCFIQFYMTRKDIDIKNYLINGLGFCLIGIIMYLVIYKIEFSSAIVTMGVQIVIGAIVYITLACIFMVKIIHNPTLVNIAVNTLNKILKRK